MRIIPVLDLMGGLVVRGVGGRRQEYRPIVSRLTISCQPADVARAFRDHFGLTECYLADLGAIAGAPPALATYAAVQAQGIRLWVDAGVREPEQAVSLAAGVACVVVGLETVAGPAVLRELQRRLGPERLVFSLDLKNGQPLGTLDAWPSSEPLAVASEAVACGVRRLIVLDLARVGVGDGTGTEDLCRQLSRMFPEVAITAGGGVRGPDDLRRLRDAGVKAVLVASALHDGRIQPADLRDL